MNVLLISSSHVMNNLIHNILIGDNITTTTNGNIDIPKDTDVILIEENLITDNFLNTPYPGIIITAIMSSDLMKKIMEYNKLYIVKPFNGEHLKERIQQVIG